MSYALEVEMIAKARARPDMLTTPYVFNAADAKAMATAGADIVVCHLGLTTGGAIGAQTALKLEDCPARIDAWAAAALGVNPRFWCWRMAGRWPSRRRRVHHETHAQMSRLLRSILDGAASGGAGADGAGFESSRRSAGVERRLREVGTMSGIAVGELILWLIVALIVIVVAVYIVNWLYHRSSKEVSFVRTGFLGEQVVINGGAFVLAFHS